VLELVPGDPDYVIAGGGQDLVLAAVTLERGPVAVRQIVVHLDNDLTPRPRFRLRVRRNLGFGLIGAPDGTLSML
jgi:hypothetical protein